MEPSGKGQPGYKPNISGTVDEQHLNLIRQAAKSLPDPPSDSHPTDEQAEADFFNKDASNDDLEEQKQRLELAKLRAEVDQLRHNNHSLGLKNQSDYNDIALRESFAGKTFWFVSCWSIALVVLLSITGAFNIVETLDSSDAEITFLSDAVLIALISAVTVNVMAVFIAVVTYLFPKK